VNQDRRDTLTLEHRHCYSQASSESVRRSLFGQFRRILLEMQRGNDQQGRPAVRKSDHEPPVERKRVEPGEGKAVSIQFHDGTILT